MAGMGAYSYDTCLLLLCGYAGNRSGGADESIQQYRSFSQLISGDHSGLHSFGNIDFAGADMDEAVPQRIA